MVSMQLPDNLQQRLDALHQILAFEMRGRVSGLTGLTVEARDFPAPLGAQCSILTRLGAAIPAEVIGFRGDVSVLMPLGEMIGIASGDQVACGGAHASVPVGSQLLGRVINAAGEPIDGQGPLLCQTRRTVEPRRIEPLQRARIDTPIGTGIRAVDALTSCGAGQRMGIFSGPGVGKSILLGMIARYTAADVCVIGLVGERGREVREFIEKDLGPEGLARAVVVVTTADEAAPLRVRAGFVAATVAEYFCEQGKNVLLLMDSVTRIAMAQRQIGLALGESPATKGYTPSVFALLPRLLERCGRMQNGSITAFYTVLVEGDDLSEPISDAMRGILDGHLWLDRNLANRGHYPAIDVLESISRAMVNVVNPDHLEAARTVVRLVAIYKDIEDLVNLGAYAPGTNAEFDLAVQARDRINQFLTQNIDESNTFDQVAQMLKNLAESFKKNEPALQGAALGGPDAENPQAGSAQAPIGLERMMAGL